MNDLELIRKQLHEDSLLKSEDIKLKKLQEQLLNEAFSIVNNNPYRALELRNKIYKLSNGLPGNVVFLSQEIVEQIAKDNIEDAFNLLHIIDFEELQSQTLMKIIHKAKNNQSLLDKMLLTLYRIGDHQDFINMKKEFSKTS